MTPSLVQVLQVLRREQPRARSVGVEIVGVTGSTARGEARAGSDIDIVVRQAGKTTLFRLHELETELAGLLGSEVDLVFTEAMRPERRAHIERDLVLL